MLKDIRSEYKETLTKICLEVELVSKAEAETHRELSIERAKRLRNIYAIAETALGELNEKNI